MKNIYKFISLSFLIITLAFSLNSQADSYNWSGVYLGAKFGYGTMDTDLKNKVEGVQHYFNSYGETINFNDSSTIGGIFIGGQKQHNNYLYGIEIDHIFNEFDETEQMTGPFALNNFKVEMKNISSISGKFGYAYEDNLIYFKLGLASAKFRTQADEIPNFDHIGKSDKRQNGYLLGLGFDRPLNFLDKNLILSFNYDHYEFNDKTQIGDDLSAFISTYDVNVDPSFDTFMVKLSYKFN